MNSSDVAYASPQSLIGLDDVVKVGLLLILPVFLQGNEVVLDMVEVRGLGSGLIP